MEIRKVYEKLGEDYDKILERLEDEEWIEKYLRQFAQTDHWRPVEDAVNHRDMEACYEAVHNLKGLSLNMGFDRLAACATEFCDILKQKKALNEVLDIYDTTITEYLKVEQVLTGL